jgi:threonine 3-dehydrogenase
MPVPEPKGDEVLAKTRYAAICGSDIKIFKWTPWCEHVVPTLPFIPGHECSGTVVGTGPDVKEVREGDLIAVETHIPCESCWQCRHNRKHTCLNMELFGHTVNGCFSEYFIIPERVARRLPAVFPAREGCLLEPLGIPLRAVLRGNVTDDTLAVIGCGPIGQLAIGAAKMKGAIRIFALDTNEKRLEIAQSMGATDVLDPSKKKVADCILCSTGGSGVGTVIEASGSIDALHEALGYVRVGGTIFTIGHPTQEICIDVSPRIVLREVQITGIFGRRIWDTWEKAEDVVLSESMVLESIVTHTFSLEDHEEAFRTAESGEGCKIIFDMEK